MYGGGTLTNNTFTGNTAGYSGGGIYVTGESTLTNNTISGNTAVNRGGGGVYAGVYASGSTVTLTNNIITGNTSSGSGGSGGVYASGSTVTLTNNIITGNTAEKGSGGGLYVYRPATVTLTNNTIIENTAEEDSGGIYVQLYNNSNTAQIYNNIIYNNTANTKGDDLYINNDGNGDFLSSPVNLYNNDFNQTTAGTYIEIPFSIDPNNIDSDPLFIGDGDYHLTVSSPCINSGDNNAPDLPETDKDGNPRIVGGTVDMGAYEANSGIYVNQDGICADKTPCYSTIQAAIDATNTGSVIKIAQGTYSNAITLSTSKSLTLQGGWNSSYDTQTSNTTFIKAPKATEGSLTLQMVTIKP